MTDCIVGIATGTPDGGVAVLRLSGEGTAAVAASLGLRLPAPRYAAMRHICVGDEEDEQEQALVLWMPGPSSFTGEDVLELHVHAGVANVRAVFGACVRAGARPAEAGEFTKRAFAHEKLSLDQAEALAALLSAKNSEALTRARRLLRGELGEQVDELLREIFVLRVEIEAHLDFPEDVDSQAAAQWSLRLGEFGRSLQGWLASHDRHVGRNQVFRVVLAGPVNAGKSSLFNALVGRERAIVSDQAGTTRDVVETQVHWEGSDLLLLDTAGQREGSGEIESRGIELGQRELEQADLLLWVRGCDQPAMAAPPTKAPVLGVVTKVDLDGFVGVGAGEIGVSTVAGYESSLRDLEAQILAKVREWELEGKQLWLGVPRHAMCVDRCLKELEAAGELMKTDGGLEMVAFHLQAAQAALVDIRGVDRLAPVGEEVLHAIFSQFCIGK